MSIRVMAKPGGRPARIGAAHAPDRAIEESTAEVEQVFDRTIEEGCRRLSRGWSNLLGSGVIAGIDVGTGVLAELVVKKETGSTLLAALAFVIGFIALTLAQSELFTEDFLVPVSTVVAKRGTWLQLGRLWSVTLLANLLGGWVITWLIIVGVPKVRGEAINSGRFYVDIGFGGRAFALGLLGGAAITLMTWIQHSVDSPGARLVPAVTTAFLLAATPLNHAIISSLLMFSALHTGHAPFGYLAYLHSVGWAILANVVGGIGLVTLLRFLQAPHKVAAERERSSA